MLFCFEQARKYLLEIRIQPHGNGSKGCRHRRVRPCIVYGADRQDRRDSIAAGCRALLAHVKDDVSANEVIVADASDKGGA